MKSELLIFTSIISICCSLRCNYLPIKVNKFINELLKYDYQEANTVQQGTYTYINLVASETKNGWNFCGGSFITQTKVITAAHCVFLSTKDEQIIVGAGKITSLSLYLQQRSQQNHTEKVDPKFGIMEVTVKEKHVHPDFDYKKCKNDVSILTMKEKFSILLNIATVDLFFGKEILGASCIVFGWSVQLHSVEKVYIVLSYSHTRIPFQQDKQSYICSENEFAYLGSGTPLLCNNKLYGISSHRSAFVKDCVYYTSLNSYKRWIWFISSAHSDSHTKSYVLFLCAVYHFLTIT